MRRKRARRRDHDAQEASEPVEQEDSAVEDEIAGVDLEPPSSSAVSGAGQSEDGQSPDEQSADGQSADGGPSQPGQEPEAASIESDTSESDTAGSETAPGASAESVAIHDREPLPDTEVAAVGPAQKEQTAEEPVAEAPEPEAPAPEAPAPKADESQVGPAELEALGRELERSLTGASQPPKQGGGIPNIEAPPPPAINATPEDILGVPTQTFGGEKAPQDDQKPSASAAAVELAKQGGPPPMEEFEERAQMASEVLRATGHGDRSHRIDQGSSGESHGEADAPPSDEDLSDDADRNVRFSEDVTISSRRKRKLFGR